MIEILQYELLLPVLFGANEQVFGLLGTVEPLNKDTFGTTCFVLCRRCCPLSEVVLEHTYESSFSLSFNLLGGLSFFRVSFIGGFTVLI